MNLIICPVGVILDPARRSTGTRDIGSDVLVDIGYAARQITGHFTARFRLESSRRLHVYLLHVSTLYLSDVYVSSQCVCVSVCWPPCRPACLLILLSLPIL